MTGSELSQLRYLNKEIERDKKKLLELEAFATGTCTVISGMPHSGMLSDKTAVACQIADLKKLIDEKIVLCFNEYNRIHEFVNTIDDSILRQAIVLRFANGFSWQQVAFHIGGGNTADGIRKVCTRFIENS